MRASSIAFFGMYIMLVRANSGGLFQVICTVGVSLNYLDSLLASSLANRGLERKSYGPCGESDQMKV